jgi:hypothetical protein
MEPERRKIVIFAPSHDEKTKLARRYAQFVIDRVQSGPLDILPLVDDNANGESLSDAMRDTTVVGVDVYSHGEASAFFDCNGSRVHVGSAESSSGKALEAGTKGIDVLACRTADAMGPTAVGNGARFFIGYADIVYAMDRIEDMDVLTTAKRHLYEGQSARAAFVAQRDAMQDRRRQLAEMGLPDLAAFYGRNLRGYRLLGTEDEAW